MQTLLTNSRDNNYCLKKRQQTCRNHVLTEDLSPVSVEHRRGAHVEQQDLVARPEEVLECPCERKLSALRIIERKYDLSQEKTQQGLFRLSQRD